MTNLLFRIAFNFNFILQWEKEAILFKVSGVLKGIISESQQFCVVGRQNVGETHLCFFVGGFVLFYVLQLLRTLVTLSRIIPTFST
jgi:hypothetical protein